jgi:hypothetical protein
MSYPDLSLIYKKFGINNHGASDRKAALLGASPKGKLVVGASGSLGKLRDIFQKIKSLAG